MKQVYQLAYLTMFICLPLQAEIDFDKHDSINGVTLQTGKIESTRHYHGAFDHTFSYPLQVIKNGITNFSEKCNNQHKNKRKLTDITAKCKYQAEQLIESLVIKDIGDSWQKIPQETDRFIVARQIYRRGHYAHYDLVQISENKNMKGQKVVTIALNMMDDQEVGQYIKPTFKRDSDFTKSSEIYTLTEMAPDKTKLSYQFETQTEHWLLNKEISVPQVFAYIGQSISEKIKTLDQAALAGKREVASHK